MKRFVAVLAASIVLMGLTGCASIIKSSGGVMREDLALRDAGVDKEFASLNAKLAKQTSAMEQLLQGVNEELAKRDAAHNQQFQTISDKVAVLSTEMETAKALSAEIAQAKATIADLLAKLDSLSDQTLLRLAKLIQDALAASAGSAAAGSASAGGAAAPAANGSAPASATATPVSK